ncbi:MAG: ABC transporter ATP-binding protein, partial [Deltaproteobacteria bacterium]|nr:ABC transporter ATP-binding protein [Deltaproteobacteria bacterium]
QNFWEFINHLAQDGMTVFVTTHYMDEARNCQKIIMINEGRIVATGSPSEIICTIFPERPNADLNDVFIHLMSRKER